MKIDFALQLNKKLPFLRVFSHFCVVFAYIVPSSFLFYHKIGFFSTYNFACTSHFFGKTVDNIRKMV